MVPDDHGPLLIMAVSIMIEVGLEGAARGPVDHGVAGTPGSMIKF